VATLTTDTLAAVPVACAAQATLLIAVSPLLRSAAAMLVGWGLAGRAPGPDRISEGAARSAPNSAATQSAAVEPAADAGPARAWRTNVRRLQRPRRVRGRKRPRRRTLRRARASTSWRSFDGGYEHCRATAKAFGAAHGYVDSHLPNHQPDRLSPPHAGDET